MAHMCLAGFGRLHTETPAYYPSPETLCSRRWEYNVEHVFDRIQRLHTATPEVLARTKAQGLRDRRGSGII